MFSTKIIKQDEFNDFQKYINRCKTEEQNTYKSWNQDIIDSGIKFSKDDVVVFNQKYKILENTASISNDFLIRA